MLSYLPEDIMVNILSRLPVKSISRFRCVCKTWSNLFKNPNFIKMHLDHGVEKQKFKIMLTEDDVMYTSIDYFDPASSLTCYDITRVDYRVIDHPLGFGLHIVGACNGLLCLILAPYCGMERICLWNPSTKEYKNLPIPEDQILSYLDVDTFFVAYGFGYDCNNEDYKLVRTLNFCDGNAPLGCEVKVYSLLSNTWKQIPGTYPYEIISWGVLVNENVHWYVYRCIGGSPAYKSIVSFNFGVERLAEVLLPENLDDEMTMDVGDLGGCLCIFCTSSYDDSFVVWVMKEYGVRESWTKLFTLVQQSLVRPSYKLIQSFKIGEFLLYIKSEDPNSHVGSKYALVLYNPKNERVRALKIRGGDWSDATTSFESYAKTYVESLVSLNTGMYVPG